MDLKSLIGMNRSEGRAHARIACHARRVWSIVNAPVLAFDAGRLPSGAAFAADLAGALTLDARALMLLDLLARELPPMTPGAPEPETVLAALGSLRAGLAGTPTIAPGTAARLARAPLGTASGIADFVRDDVLGWTRYRDGAVTGRRWTAGVELVGEVVTASHAGRLADHPRRAAWERLRPEPNPATGLPNGVDYRLAHLADRLTPDALYSIDRAVARSRRTAGESWAELVHAATQVLFVTGRLRAAAVAQLRVAQVVRAVHPEPAPLDALSAISGAVHAWASQDLLDDARYAGLVAPVEAVLGAS